MAAQVATSLGNNDPLDLQIQGLNINDDSDDNNNIDDDNDDDNCSVDTQDAFLDMLGLPTVEALDSVLVMDEEEEPATAAAIDTTTSKKTGTTMPTIARNIALPPKCSRYGHAPSHCAAVVVDHFWPPQECQALIQMGRGGGFQYITEATHTAPDGSKYKVQLANPNPHKLAVFEDSTILDRMWTKLVEHPATHLLQSEWLLHYQQRCWNENKRIKPVGLNPRIRVLEYNAKDGDRFEPHFDATTHVGPHTSHITVLLYLNDGNGVDFDGGETLYLDSHISKYNNKSRFSTTSKDNKDARQEDGQDHVVKIAPQAGTLVMFEHDLYHAGAPLLWGTKYVMRTDILFETITTEEGPTATANNEQQTITKYKQDKEQNIAQTQQTRDMNSSANMDSPTKKPLLVMTLCQRLEWTSDEQAILNDMGLLQCTLESFLVPGSKLLQVMLVDGGLAKYRVQELIQAALLEERHQTQQSS